MADKSDSWLVPLRKKLWPKLHPILEEHDGYAIGPTSDGEYVATLPMHRDEVAHLLLHHLDFDPNPVAAQKYRDDDWQDPEQDDWAEGTYTLRDIEDGGGPHWLPSSLDAVLPDWMARMQLHITLYADEDDEGQPVTHVFAHWEYSWIVHPVRHKWPGKRGHWSAEDGVERMLALLDEAEVEHYQDAP